MKKMTMSIAVLALIGDASAHRHHHKLNRRNQSLVQFASDYELDEEAMTTQSLAES